MESYNHLDDGQKEKFDEIMGPDMASAFKSSKMEVELNLNVMTEVEERFERLNKLFDDLGGDEWMKSDLNGLYLRMDKATHSTYV